MSYEKHKAGLAVDCIKLEQTPIEKAIWSVLDEYCDAENHPLKEYDLVCDVLQKVEEAVSKCTFTGWIPCSERLPERDGEYLVTINSDYFYGEGSIVPMTHSEDKWWYYNDEQGYLDWFTDDVLAWMPLPEPYKKGEQE